MNLFVKNLLIPGLLISVSGICALAQQSTPTPAQRLKLTVVDNKSDFIVSDVENHYVNTLQVSQADGPFKLTAGLLYNGDNYIVLHRMDNQDNDIECARINLNTEVKVPITETVGAIDFYNNFTHQDTYLTAADLADYPGWGTSENGEGLAMQTNGYAYTRDVDGLTFTIPDEFIAGNITVTIAVGSDVVGGYFSYGINDDWTVVSTRVTANQSSFSWTITDVRAGDVIAFLGASYSSSSGYSLAVSPDIRSISLSYTPNSTDPIYKVTPYLSVKDANGTWGAEQALGGTTVYQNPDVINLDALGTIDDDFRASTATNNHPEDYTYKVTMDANIVLPDASAPLIVYPFEDVDMWMNTSATVNVLGLNIEDNVTITTTGDFTVSPASLTAEQMNSGQDVTVSYTGSAAHADGTLTVTTGSLTSTINVTYGLYSCVNFLNSTATNVTYAEYIGPNNWQFNSVSMYNGSGSNYNYLAYLQDGGSIVYNIPDNFNGTAVEVTILSGTSGSDSTGDLIVNGETYTYTAASTSHTWTVTAGAGDTITITAPTGALSLDIAKVEITGVR